MHSDQSLLQRRVEQAVWGVAIGVSMLFATALPWAVTYEDVGMKRLATARSLVDLALAGWEEHDRALPVLMLMMCVATTLAAWFGAAKPHYFGLASLTGVVTAVIPVAISLWDPGETNNVTPEALTPAYGMFVAVIPILALLVATIRARVFRGAGAPAVDRPVLR
ncbi:hypothetical protein ABGB14_40550 [Nonomuraea sp. B10E15]|uniref:hypothetical protein n=1 Tax=Nonomuraea sp. B10E15 TaxID=3153560 RepID=UPI00325C42DD